MNMILREINSHKGGTQRIALMRAAEFAREYALGRLIAILEGDPLNKPRFVPRQTEGASSRLARLRLAHASYMLANAGDIERISDGVYVRLSVS